MPHGYAISIGMMISCMVSEKVCGFDRGASKAIKHLLVKYNLPTQIDLNANQIISVIKMDKKRNNEKVDFIVLEKIGTARIETITFDVIHETLNEYLHAGDH